MLPKKTGGSMLKNFPILTILFLLILSNVCYAGSKEVKIQLIRNATMKITYGGQTILTDPMLSPKDAIRSFAGIAKNPTVELPIAAKDIPGDVNCVIVTHTHPDHFDTAAASLIRKDMPLFCQPGDDSNLKMAGFTNVSPVEKQCVWNGITIIRTGGKHGSGKILERMGNVSGIVLQAEGEPTVYWVGDSILCDEVKKTVEKFNPDIIITHSGGAKIPGFDPIIMDAQQTVDIANLAPKSKIVAIHMESLDHCGVTRKIMRDAADKAGITQERLIIPKDGETISLK